MRLNALTLLFGALIATGFPMRAERQVEAHPATSSPGTAPVVQTSTPLPDFVPVINFDQFLLATRRSDVGSRNVASPAARAAAVALSAKFALHAPADPDRDDLRAVVQHDPVARPFVDMPVDPKRLVQMAALEAAATQDAGQNDDSGTAESANGPQRSNAAKRDERRSSRRIQLSRSAAKTSGARRVRNGRTRGRRRVAEVPTQERSNSQNAGATSYLAPLIGFRSLTPDRRLTR